MFLAFIFGSLLTSLTVGTTNYEECKEVDFEPKACLESRIMHDVGVKSCAFSGKKLVGNSACE